MNKSVSLIINGKKETVKDPEDLTLITLLRERLGLLGTKVGCGEGHCGTCMVIVDGRAKKSCLLKVKDLEGTQIETIENLNKGKEIHPLQKAFLEEGAVQCGFCTPGMIMSAKALLDKNLQPSEDEIKKALKQNICRCTGYQKIIKAVKLASSYLKEGKKTILEENVSSPLGKSVIKNDGLKKVKGEPIYVDDLFRENMLYGHLHLSSEPHAEILAVDISSAQKIPGVVKVITADDIPGSKNFGLIIPHQPVLAYDKVRYVGDPIALVLAETKEQAAMGAKAIKVSYKKLRSYYEPKEALKDGAVKIHAEGNKLIQLKIRKGDYEKAFDKADVIVETDYKTPFVEHAYLEPEGALAEYKDGRIVVWCPSQSSHEYKKMIAATLDLPSEQVRVILTRTGGAFGGREEPTVQIQAALGTFITKRPVKIILNRRDSIRMSTKRHATYLHYKTGATQEGKVIAAEVKIYSDTGAYASAGEPVALRNTAFAMGPYEVPNVKVDTYSVYTNNVPGGAFRGFGSPQVCFSAEIQMDMMAQKLKIDPFEFRVLNALEENKATITGHVLGKGVGFKECLAAVAAKIKEEKLPSSSGTKKIGLGIAGGYKNVGMGAALPEDVSTIIELGDRGVTLYIGCVDSGQGVDTALAQILAEVLGCYYKDITVVSGDTDLTPDIGVTTASRMVFLAGNAVAQCAEKFKKSLFELVAKTYKVAHENLTLEGRECKDIDSGKTIADLKSIAQKGPLRVKHTYHPPQTDPLPEGHIPPYPTDKDINRLHFAYCFGVHAAIVEVDESTGKVRVLKIIAAHDLGKTINPQSAEGQIEGGVVMGLGYALRENFFLKKGWPVQDSLAKLKLLRTIDIPEIVPLLIEENNPDGPFGAKGMAELPIAPTAPAVSNAIYNAIGIRVTEIPVDPKRLKK